MPSLTIGLLTLSFAAGHLYFTLQLNHQSLESRLAHRFNPTQRFIQNAALMLRPIRFAGDAPEFPAIECCPGRAHTFRNQAIDGKCHCRNAGDFDRARRQADGLMTETRRGNQQSRLHLVTF